MSTSCWISLTSKFREQLRFQGSFCTFQISCLNPTLQSCEGEHMCAHTHTEHLMQKLTLSRFHIQIFLAWHRCSDITQLHAVPVLFSKYSWDHPPLRLCWQELASGLPCPFAAWTALTRKHLGQDAPALPVVTDSGGGWALHNLGSRMILENNILLPGRQIFGY